MTDREDSITSRLADDLAWALARLDELKDHTKLHLEHAERYFDALQLLEDYRSASG